MRWSRRTLADIRRISGYWLERDPEHLPAVVAAIRRRVSWIADAHYLSGNPIAGLPGNYRRYLERTYGYKIYFRIEGDPPTVVSVITVRHGRERPLKPATIRKSAR